MTQGTYAHVNGLDMYYEIHGTGRPLVLLHGSFSAIGTSFGALLPDLAQTRQVIGVEQQGHGHTADIDRPLTVEQMADDTTALLKEIGITNADIFGYSLGAGIALQLAIRYPELVRKLIVASVTYNETGFHPGLLAGLDQLKPENMYGSPWHDEYLRIAPHPDDFPKLVAKVKELNHHLPVLTDQAIRSIQAPTLIILGDSDIVRPEHAVAMFRLLGGGVPGDNAGLPNSQLAVLPGTTHVTVVQRADLLRSIIPAFLDTRMPDAR